MGHSETSATNLPALIPGEGVRLRVHVPAPAETPSFVDAAFEAQRLGQPGVRRGLKGGAPVLSAARGAYLSAEWSGETDRRPAPGLVKVREV